MEPAQDQGYERLDLHKIRSSMTAMDERGEILPFIPMYHLAYQFHSVL